MDAGRRAWIWGRPVALLVGGLAASVSGVGAQEMRAFSVEESLACFEESRRALETSSDCNPGVVAVEYVLLEPESFGKAKYQAVLDGLQRLATSAPHIRVQISALNWLATAGELEATPPTAEVVARLGSVYRHIANPTLRSAIAQRMLRQRNKAAAIQLLTRIARDHRPGDAAEDFPPAAVAISALAKMGPEGRAALERLHAQGKLKNPIARRALDRLAEHGFRDPGPPR